MNLRYLILLDVTEVFSRQGDLPCIPEQYSKSLTGLIKAMLHIDVRCMDLFIQRLTLIELSQPDQRPSAIQLLQDECLQMTLRYIHG